MKNKGKRYDIAIIGGGTAGSILARELSCKGLRIAVVERGRLETKIGSLYDCFRYYDLPGLLKGCLKSKEGVLVWQAVMGGGTSVVSCGNGSRALENELRQLGIDLTVELNETEEELGIKPLNENLLSQRSIRIREAGKSKGIQFHNMPKLMNQSRCVKCGTCVYGCKFQAKWSATDALIAAERNGVDCFYSAAAQNIIVQNNASVGIDLKSQSGQIRIFADRIILSAGALQTPVLLKKAGLEATGNTLFVDMLVNVYGVAPDEFKGCEPTMALVDHSHYDTHGYIISPYVNFSRVYRSREMGLRGFVMPSSRINGLMVKIRDENVGKVLFDGTFSKFPTQNDKVKLDMGVAQARSILLETGIPERTLIMSKIQGAHPGGTAPLGVTVGNDLQTSIKGLYVCDASVLPTAPGLPPIATIVALAKKLSKSILR